eukprot:TsM_000390400 transcript=TsM_000390400 gene=TsM_000390400
MVCRFALIFLVAVVLASGDRTFGDDIFVPYLRCFALSATEIGVFWDAGEMVGHGVEEIKVKVEKAIHPHKIWNATVSANNGKVIIRDLKAKTIYRVDVDGYRNEIMVFGSQRFATTLPKNQAQEGPKIVDASIEPKVCAEQAMHLSSIICK